METVIHPPKTLMEVFKGLPEGTLAQLIENELIMSPAPKDSHQEILLDLASALLILVKQNKLGKARCAPYDIYLDGKNAFQPDIVFIGNENLDKIKENGFHGAPDLVIEILSSGTAHYDKNKKKDVYERTGVKEYWIVDPSDKSVTGYYLQEGKFILLEPAIAVIQSKLLNTAFTF